MLCYLSHFGLKLCYLSQKPKLILRAFPSNFSYNSIYAHFPFVIPSENSVIQKSLGKGGEDVYDWSKPTRIANIISVTSYADVAKILSDKKDWRSVWGTGIEFLTSNDKTEYGQTFCLSGDGDANTASRENIKQALYPSDWNDQVKQFYKTSTTQLLKQYSYKIAGVNQVDIVRDVINLVNTKFSAELYSLPLKTEQHPENIYTGQELYQILAIAFTLIFYDVDVAKSFALHQVSRNLTQELGKLVAVKVEIIAHSGIFADFLARLQSHPTLNDYGTHMIQRLLKGEKDIKTLVWSNLIPCAAAGIANNAQLFAQTLDYYLGDGKQYLPELYRLSKLDTPEADETLLKYYMEGSRLSHTVGLYRQNVGPPLPTTTTTIPTNTRVFCNIRAASLDPEVFPNPTQVDITRDPNLYLHYGWGPHMCLGIGASQTGAVQFFKIIFGLKNLRRAPGALGVIKTVEAAAPGQKVGGPGNYVQYMTADQSSFWPFPSTMQIQWDD